MLVASYTIFRFPKRFTIHAALGLEPARNIVRRRAKSYSFLLREKVYLSFQLHANVTANVAEHERLSAG